MEIEYQLSKKDYIEATRLYLKFLLQKRPWIFILFTLLFIFALTGQTKEWWRFLTAIAISPVLASVLLYFIPLFISVIRLNNALKKDKSGLEKKRLTVTDEGLLIESENKTQLRKWESIVSAQSNDKFIYLILADKKYLPFPKRAFPSESDAINFLGFIQNKIIKTWGASKFPINRINKKPNYAIGLICLIPVVGAVAGIVFIANGISNYKDKWFILMGFGGILFTLGISCLVFYYFDLGKEFRKGFVPASQRQLNSVMKAVEFYKLKNGVYPDSLVQVTYDNSDIWIYDPLKPDEHVNKSDEYNYQKVGNHYYLFSSGIDGIPNTKDDIYPQVARSDSAKFGLIRRSY